MIVESNIPQTEYTESGLVDNLFSRVSGYNVRRSVHCTQMDAESDTPKQRYVTRLLSLPDRKTVALAWQYLLSRFLLIGFS